MRLTLTGLLGLLLAPAASFRTEKARALPEGPLIITYASWGECGPEMTRAAEEGANVLIWFANNLENKDGKPEITGSLSKFDCVADVAKTLRDKGLKTVHLASIGGWNAPHPGGVHSGATWWEAWSKWNRDVASRPEKGFDGFDGIDWDLEGNDNPDSPHNTMSLKTLDLMGTMSQAAKKAGYLVAMAPPESYLDPKENRFSLSLKHVDPLWEKKWGTDAKFPYHSRNAYAYLLAKYATTALPAAPATPALLEAAAASNGKGSVDTFDLVSVQLYEGWSKIGYDAAHGGDTAAYLGALVEMYTNGWKVDFSSVPEAGLGKATVRVSPRQLVLGLANAWAVPKQGEDAKFLYIPPRTLQSVYTQKQDSFRGFMYWCVQEDGKPAPARAAAHSIHRRVGGKQTNQQPLSVGGGEALNEGAVAAAAAMEPLFLSKALNDFVHVR